MLFRSYPGRGRRRDLVKSHFGKIGGLTDPPRSRLDLPLWVISIPLAEGGKGTVRGGAKGSERRVAELLRCIRMLVIFVLAVKCVTGRKEEAATPTRTTCPDNLITRSLLRAPDSGSWLFFPDGLVGGKPHLRTTGGQHSPTFA